jgi:hypothetical protein
MTNNSTAVGTFTGTILSVLVLPSTATIILTMEAAVIGATTSFLFTLLLKRVYNHFTKNKSKE